MKKITSLLYIALLMLSLLSCSNQDESGKKKELELAKSKYLMGTISKSGIDEFISLLCIKYELNSEVTRKIINDFTRENSVQNFLSISETKTIEEFEQLKTNLSRPSVEERINKICTETNIEPSTVASLLIDYEIWYEAQNDGTYQ
jgi:hypothetical protein